MFRSAASVLPVVMTVCFAGACTARAAHAPATQPVVVVELFTSEGCSSCPAADEVLGSLAGQNEVEGVQIIALGMHVDYWNNLGWADRFSSPQFSERQQQYAQTFHSSEVYTPQMIVDGTEQFIGSDKKRAKAAISSAAAQARGTVVINLAPDPKNGSSLNCGISVDGIGRNGDLPADVLLAITEDDLSTDVPRGENAGQTLHHTAVVRMLQRIATMNSTESMPFSASASISLQSAWRVNQLHVAVFIQNPRTGKILAAGCRRLASR